MRPRAFTLVELLVVLSIIVVLAAILLPSMDVVWALGRRTLCAHNLNRICTAFQVHGTRQGITLRSAYPDKDIWPTVPQTILAEKSFYRCPEDTEPFVPAEEVFYQLYTEADNMVIGFEEVPDYCRVLDRAEYIEYRFDAGTGGGRGTIDYDDVVFRITKTRPKVATFWPDDPSRPFRGIGKMSLLLRGQVVPGWEDFNHVAFGSQLVLEKEGHDASYGINTFSEEIKLMSGKVVVVDYTEAVVELDAETDRKLRKSARHLGRLNVLFADQCVRVKWAGELDTVQHADVWWP